MSSFCLPARWPSLGQPLEKEKLKQFSTIFWPFLTFSTLAMWKNEKAGIHEEGIFVLLQIAQIPGKN